ncbi:MAG: FAD-dependent oxidoreductase [Thermodesulfobacteriota bacterium]
MTENREVLIIGGGISGITVALELAQLGIHSTLVERESSIGGLANSFCCKASEACNKCFACVVDKRIWEIQNHPNISILTQTEPVAVEGIPGKYIVSLKRVKEKIRLTPSAIVIAVGIEPYDASEKVEYGYGRYKNVITARDLDEMLRFEGRIFRPSDRKIPKTLAFFQCVGSRDQSIGNLYCSQVCCAYALRLIKAIRYKYPEINITFLYMDIQPAGASFQTLLDSCRKDRGIRLIRTLPSKVYHSPLFDTLRVRVIDSEKGEVVEETFDLIVLSVGMVIGKNASSIPKLFGLNFTEDGFFTTPSNQVGIFIAGACSGPKDIDRSIIHSKSIAYEVVQYLKGRD